ncbi:MAG: tRNA (cytidine(34)-2'-O)-methyltransferase [Rhodomicrobium sp.]
MRIALYQPDIAQNTGTMLRLAACLNVAVDIIEPAGFDLSSRALRRAALDYFDYVKLKRHNTYDDFRLDVERNGSRIVLLTTKADAEYHNVVYRDTDVILAGRESAGAPQDVHASVNLRVKIPMRPELRSLNVAVSLAMVLGEALRQTSGFSQLR